MRLWTQTGVLGIRLRAWTSEPRWSGRRMGGWEGINK
jgi:hypothetical protein